jgi:DNA-binding MarR family transcriptional regulator
MAVASQQTAAEAWALIGQLFFEYGRPRIMAIAQETDLSPPQSLVLRLLDEPRPMSELAQLMHCDNSNLTGIIDRLSERGLVERTQAEGDRRVRLIALTQEGRRIRDELNRRLAEPPGPLASLGEDDQTTLRDILARALGR